MNSLTPTLSITAATLHLHERLASATRQEAEEAVQSAVPTDQREATLHVCFAQARTELAALREAHDWVFRTLEESGISPAQLHQLVRSALVIAKATEDSFGMLQREGAHHGKAAASTLSELERIRKRFAALDELSKRPFPEPNRERINRGMEEMQRGEGEYVEDVLARLMAGGEP
jgi:hypothetical protein